MARWGNAQDLKIVRHKDGSFSVGSFPDLIRLDDEFLEGVPMAPEVTDPTTVPHAPVEWDGNLLRFRSDAAGEAAYHRLDRDGVLGVTLFARDAERPRSILAESHNPGEGT